MKNVDGESRKSYIMYENLMKLSTLFFQNHCDIELNG